MLLPDWERLWTTEATDWDEPDGQGEVKKEICAKGNTLREASNFFKKLPKGASARRRGTMIHSIMFSQGTNQMA